MLGPAERDESAEPYSTEANPSETADEPRIAAVLDQSDPKLKDLIDLEKLAEYVH